MKKSRRLIRNTILALNGLMVLYVGINRLYAVDETTHAPRRTDAAELARLRDFNAIEVHGDFGLDVVQEAGYSVGLPPPGRSKGEFVAIVRGNVRLGVAHHDHGGAERGQQHHGQQGNDERRSLLVGNARAEAVHVCHHRVRFKLRGEMSKDRR